MCKVGIINGITSVTQANSELIVHVTLKLVTWSNLAGSLLRWKLKRNFASSFSRSWSCRPNVFDSLSTSEQLSVDYLSVLALCTLSYGLILYLGDRTSLKVRIITISFQ